MDLYIPHRDTTQCNPPNHSGRRPGRSRPDAVDHDLPQRIEALIPRLTRYARVLTRDVTAAEDLVQECLTRALGKIHLWERGFVFRVLLFKIFPHQNTTLARRDTRRRASTELQVW